MAGKKRPGPHAVSAPVRKTAAARAAVMVEQLLGSSEEILKEALTRTQEVALLNTDGSVKLDDDGLPVTKMIGGDVRTAMWVMDRVWPKKGSVLPKHFNVDMTTIDGVLEVAKQATEAMLKQEMTVDDAQGLLDYLYQYCQLRAFERLDELKLLLAELEAKQANGGAVAGMDGKLLPAWGNLTDKTETANKTPAE